MTTVANPDEHTEELTLSYIASGNIEWHSHSGNSLTFLLKLNIYFHDSAVTFLSICHREMKVMFLQTSYTIFIALCYCPKLETIQITFIKWMAKLWYICTMKYYSALKRNKILLQTTICMDFKGGESHWM